MWRSVCPNLSTFWILYAFRLCVKVAQSWQFVIVITSLQSFLGPGQGIVTSWRLGYAFLAWTELQGRYAVRLMVRGSWVQTCMVRSDSLYLGNNVREGSVSLVFVCRPVDIIFLIGHFDYWWHYCSFECGLGTHQSPLMVGWHNVEIFATSFVSLLERYVMAPSWSPVFEGPRQLLEATSPVLSCSSHFVLKHHAGAQWIWGIAM